MQFLTFLTTVSLLVIGASAASKSLRSRQDDPHVGDFRTFGVAGCFDDNQGVYTQLQSDVGVCHTFAEPVGSLDVADLNDGCTCRQLLLSLYLFPLPMT